jgi:hypothetical protein
MSGPIVFISHNVVREGGLDGFRRFFEAGVGAIETDKPGTVVFLAYAGDDRVHVFPDADAMDRHLEGARERAGAADEFIEGVGVDIYGTPNDDALAMMRALFSDDAPLRLLPGFMGGYLRPGSDRSA